LALKQQLPDGHPAKGKPSKKDKKKDKQVCAVTSNEPSTPATAI